MFKNVRFVVPIVIGKNQHLQSWSVRFVGWRAKLRIAFVGSVVVSGSTQVQVNAGTIIAQQKIQRRKEKVIRGKTCPVIRLCPSCKILIEHTDSCPQMECRCKQRFCFICLQQADSSGRYVCGSGSCNKAPIQTVVWWCCLRFTYTWTFIYKYLNLNVLQLYWYPFI